MDINGGSMEEIIKDGFLKTDFKDAESKEVFDKLSDEKKEVLGEIDSMRAEIIAENGDRSRLSRLGELRDALITNDILPDEVKEEMSQM